MSGEASPGSSAFASSAHDEAPIPDGIKLTPLDPVFQADPAAVYRELQRRAPVHRDSQLGGVIVSGHDVVHRVAYDLELIVDPRKAREDDPVRVFVNLDPDREPSMLFLDDPEHKRLRNLVSRAFTPSAV
ncbi:MAG: hypothetical protein JRG89_21025, partial [Deltaproteobacteria bacterium]|nr:hypothetical protein [Deltaproteobacteria bacterium]